MRLIRSAIQKKSLFTVSIYGVNLLFYFLDVMTFTIECVCRYGKYLKSVVLGDGPQSG